MTDDGYATVVAVISIILCFMILDGDSNND